MPRPRVRWARARRRTTFLVLRQVVRLIGFARVGLLGRWLGDLQYLFGYRVRRNLLRDMAPALGRDAADPRTREQLRHAYRINTIAALETLAMFDRRQDLALLASRCVVEGDGIERLQTALAGGRGAILLPSHAGNGAILALALKAAGMPVSVVYKQARMMSADFFGQGFPLYDVEGILANEGIKAYGRMLGALKKNHIVFVMMDQGVKRAEDGMTVRFLGKTVSMAAGPAQLARAARAPLLPVATTGADERWHFRIDGPVERPPGSTLETDFEQLVRITERNILDHPELWSWPHRRWHRCPADSGRTRG